jgi:hypothetical protein
VKTVKERSPEFFRGGAWKADDVGGGNPVEISPYFATIDFLGSSWGGQLL